MRGHRFNASAIFKQFCLSPLSLPDEILKNPCLVSILRYGQRNLTPLPLEKKIPLGFPTRLVSSDKVRAFFLDASILEKIIDYTWLSGHNIRSAPVKHEDVTRSRSKQDPM